ncbi:hypothetical protein SODALDRAFT_310937 [Sodiomyces alkalinus F11]|uniref:Uncharacterized protein n=1 Tax=Sodiomyces alkalinus (strain CBS 110278 / VKM F-3762 / F11) TaxID=1314773 RepID=A0A3N2PY46_SODAK|nr:hypothetical protein SODALDRAFT_310937 [Sodiomyces alkalinus F11]ROT39441.1 hypothetical protein SODALDRAFT_310937 [Sodiomyces alkalinus F11]
MSHPVPMHAMSRSFGLAYPSPSPHPSSRRGPRTSTFSPAPSSAQSTQTSQSPIGARRQELASPGSYSSRNWVLSGRVKRRGSPWADRCLNTLGKLEPRVELEHLNSTEDEKRLFPASRTWADDELRLFEILYMRGYSPLLPKNWDMDFRGIPMPDILFATAEIHQPIISSRSGNNFRATRALIRLMELTSSVRSLMQTGQKDKAPPLILRELEEYAKWAAQDGGYDNLDIIPNIVIDIVDTTKSSVELEQYMQHRLASLAARHRKYWRIDSPADDGFADHRPAVPGRSSTSEATPWNRRFRDPGSAVTRNELSTAEARTALDNDSDARSDAASGERIGEPEVEIKIEDDELFARLELRYTQRPPVLYGMFIIHSTVLVLSTDSAKEDKDATVSYQVEVAFNVKDQGVWNAITIAIVICLARDNMVTMANDFVQLVGSPQSDPDA